MIGSAAHDPSFVGRQDPFDEFFVKSDPQVDKDKLCECEGCAARAR